MALFSFQWPVRVYIEDTDAAGIVFYANYLRFMERARTESIRALGFMGIDAIDKHLLFVVHRVVLTYHRPARLDDSLLVSANITKLGRTFMIFEQLANDGETNELLVSGEITVACVDKSSFKLKRLPANLIDAIQSRA